MFDSALANAKSISRNDSSQEQVDASYDELITAMKALSGEDETTSFSAPAAVLAAVVLLVFVIVVLLISALRKKAAVSGQVDHGYDAPVQPEEKPAPKPENSNAKNVGDIYFDEKDDNK